MGKYLGPFEVEKVLLPVSYKLKLPEAHPVFHISLLKREKDPNEITPDIMPNPIELLEGGQGAIFEVGSILNKKMW
jgi:hypothetical protein